MSKAIDQLIDALAYERDPGLLLSTDDFTRAVGSSHALHAAAGSIGLEACFGAWETGFGDRALGRFVPVVYLAEASSLD